MTRRDDDHTTPCNDLVSLTARVDSRFDKIEQKLWIIMALLALLFGGGKVLDVATATKVVAAAPVEQTEPVTVAVPMSP